MTRLAWVAAGGLVAGIALRYVPARPHAPTTARRVPAPAAGPAPRRAPLPALPGSLRGSAPDGALAVDGRGRFVATADTRRLFDYFLAATGEESPRAIRRRIMAEIRHQLPRRARRDAVALLGRYLTYRARARRIAASDADGARAAVRALRRAVLGPPVAEAFFAAEESLEDVILAERAILADASLSADERGRRVAALEAQLPDRVRGARADAVTPVRLVQVEAALRATGASDADIRSLREDAVGTAAADRLEQLDRERAAWQARVAAYRAARQVIEADASLGDAARARAIDALRTARFTPPEQRRVAALDRIEHAR